MNFKQSICLLDEITKSGSSYGLDGIFRLLDYMGNPQERLKVIHIAGTNGKGSVSNMLYHILMEAGYSIGLYNSPHILSYCEAIMLNGNNISENDFAYYANKVFSKCKKIVLDGFSHPSAFECLTAIALDYFVNSGVELAVIEVGLGGTLDATNVFNKPLISIITSISYDHTELLGSSLEQISATKAGIIKSECPVVIAPNPDEVISTLTHIANDINAPTYLLTNEQILVNIDYKNLKEMSFDITTPYFKYKHLKTHLIGSHQLINISTVLMALEVLKKHYYYNIYEPSIKSALLNTYWPCRCEYINIPIPIIIDGAHNKESLDGLSYVLKEYVSMPITFLFGALKDKDIPLMLKSLAEFSDTIFITEPLNPRALPITELAVITGKYFSSVYSNKDIYKTFDEALFYAKKTNTLLCCVGSLYLALPIRDYCKKFES